GRPRRARRPRQGRRHPRSRQYAREDPEGPRGEAQGHGGRVHRVDQGRRRGQGRDAQGDAGEEEMNLLLALLLALGDDPLAPVLAKLRETAGKSVVAIDVEREADPDGSMGSGAVSSIATTTT